MDYKIPYQNVKASILIYEPDVNFCVLKDGIFCKKPGYEMELFFIAAKLLKLNLTFVSPADGNFGSFINQTWNGIVAQLIQNETDFSAKMLTMTEIRSNFVDFRFIFHFNVNFWLILG